MMTHKTACPQCRENGNDRSGDNLIVYENGSHCFACGYNTTLTPMMEEGMEEEEDIFIKGSRTVSDILKLPLGDDPARMIDPSIVSEFQTRVEYDTETGKVKSVYYPYFDGHTVIGFKKRRLDVVKKFAFSVIGKNTSLFGIHPNIKGYGVLILVEGEADAMAARNMMQIGTIPKDCDVVSLPNGAGLDKTTMSHLTFFKSYKQIYLCLDNDAVGRSAVDKLAPWLSRLTKVKVVEIDPSVGKDASDLLVGGNHVDFLLAIKNAKERQMSGIVAGTSLSLDDLLVPEVAGFRIPFRGLHKALRGLRKGELTTITAESGIGKSTFTKELALNLIEQGLTVVLMAMEEQLDTSAKALVAMDMNIPLADFRENPPDKSKCQTSFDKLVAGGQTFFYEDDEEEMNNNKLLEALHAYARMGSVDFIFVDHLGIANAGTTGSGLSEAKQIDIFMQKLANIIKETGVGIVLVAHVKRATETVGDKGREIKLTDLRGSAAIEQYSFNVVGLERDQQSECEIEKNKLRVRVLKNRSSGFTGLCDFLQYNTDTGRIVDAPVPKPIVLDEEK